RQSTRLLGTGHFVDLYEGVHHRIIAALSLTSVPNDSAAKLRPCCRRHSQALKFSSCKGVLPCHAQNPWPFLSLLFSPPEAWPVCPTPFRLTRTFRPLRSRPKSMTSRLRPSV